MRVFFEMTFLAKRLFKQQDLIRHLKGHAHERFSDRCAERGL